MLLTAPPPPAASPRPHFLVPPPPPPPAGCGGSLMKGCRRASLGLMRLSGSRAIMRSSRSHSCASLRRSGDWPARREEKSCLTVGLGIRRRTCGGGAGRGEVEG